MKRITKTLAFLLLSLFTLSSCKEKDPVEDTTPTLTNGTVHVSLKAMWDGIPYSQSSIVSDSYGNRLRIENFTTYISNLKLIKADNSMIDLNDYHLAHFYEENEFNFTVPKGDYIGLTFLIGVPAEVNTNVDPAQYPGTHPLSVQGSQGMFWNWSTGYIFSKLEGRMDSSGDPNAELLDLFSYHTGDDHYTRIVTLNETPFSLGTGQTKSLTATVHIDKIFSPDEGDGINPALESSFHSPGPLAVRFVINFSKAFTLGLE